MNRNPVLNSPDDINDKLLLQISRNELDSLTINYEFTTKFDNREDRRIIKKNIFELILFGEPVESNP